MIPGMYIQVSIEILALPKWMIIYVDVYLDSIGIYHALT